jgi:hypothetical protein
MSRKKKVFVAIGSLGVILVIVDFCWSIFQTELAKLSNKPVGPHPSYTLAESKARGTLVAELTIEPHLFEWDGKQVSINGIWLERKEERTGTFVIIPLLLEWPTYAILDGYNVCFIPSLGSVDGFFVQEGTKLAFAMAYLNQGGTLAWGDVPNPDFKELSVLFTSDWKFSKSVRLRILNPREK